MTAKEQLEAVRKRIEGYRNWIRIVYSDLERDPVYQATSYFKGIVPLKRKLDDLRMRFAGRDVLIADYHNRIAILEAKMNRLYHAVETKRLVEMIQKQNRLKKRAVTASTKLYLKRFEKQFVGVNAKLKEHAELIICIQSELAALQRLTPEVMAKREAALVAALRAHEKMQDEFMQHRTEGQILVNQIWTWIDNQRAEETRLIHLAEVEKIVAIQQEIEAIKSALGPEKTELALRLTETGITNQESTNGQPDC